MFALGKTKMVKKDYLSPHQAEIEGILLFRLLSVKRRGDDLTF